MKKLAFLLLIVAFISACEKPKKETAKAPQRTTIEIEAWNLAFHHIDDKDNANAVFKNTRLIVDGKVKSINKDSIILKGEDIVDIDCYFEDPKNPYFKEAVKGEYVMFDCVYAGHIIDVILKDCKTAW